MEYQFQQATEGDLQELAAFVNSAYRGDSSRKGWTTEADFIGGQRTDPETLKRHLGENQKIILLKQAQRIIGCVYLRLENKIAYLGMLAVKPDLQSGGIGKKILQFAEEFVKKEWSVLQMRMTVISIREELIKWYERRGYKLSGHREDFPYGDEKYGLPQRSDLFFVELVKEL